MRQNASHRLKQVLQNSGNQLGETGSPCGGLHVCHCDPQTDVGGRCRVAGGAIAKCLPAVSAATARHPGMFIENTSATRTSFAANHA
jgi:hypothetical protein